jgi:hypothetical protein
MKDYQISCVRKMDEKRKLTQELAENMREIDRKEMEGLGFSTFRGAEVSICDTAPVFVARKKDSGKLILCWGLQVLMGKGDNPNTYLIWALGTDELKGHEKSFVKESREILYRWVDMYGCLENTVATFNKRAIRWLKWLGAEFSEPFMCGNTEYVNFKLKKKGC